MSHSYSGNRIHLVFSTKNREKQITEELQQKLWPYMAGIAKNHGFEAIKIGGVEDHAHVLFPLPATMPLAKAIQTLKSCSAKWINDLRTARDFRLAGRLWPLQRQLITNGSRQPVHRRSEGAPLEEKLR